MTALKATILCVLLLFELQAARPACGQCLLANPSFELTGAGGATFGGWNQLRAVESAPTKVHGADAAQVSSADIGSWSVSGVWQQLDSVPGERWQASVWVWPGSQRPLSGASKAIVNIEWRDAGGALIDYESHPAADDLSPRDEPALFTVQSQPAPAGTAGVRLLLGVLQGPGDPVADVFYDLAVMESLSSPSLAEQQWLHFPGGRTLQFSGRTWRVKGPGFYGPGPNQFSDGENCLWTASDGSLHLSLQQIDAQWYSTELSLEESLGYGDYIFTTRGRLDDLDPHAVLGFFLWQYGPCYDPADAWWNPNNEIDVELSRWGNPANEIAQFVVQPYDAPGNIQRFDASFAPGELTSHAFLWLADRIEFRSWRGGPQDESPVSLLQAWTYAGPHLPRPEQPRVHINLWQFGAPPASNQEVVLTDFTFVPSCGGVPCGGIITVAPTPTSPARLAPAMPNPFNPRTTIRYTLLDASTATLDVFDISGRHVRTLANGFFSAGEYAVIWDGSDDAGSRVASGVYLYRLSTSTIHQSRRMVLLK